MQEFVYEQPESHFEYVLDKRASTRGNKTEAFLCMDQVHGWCSHQKASILIDILSVAGAKTVVEIGVWGGKSLLPMAYTLKKMRQNGKIYGIDPWHNQASIEGAAHESNIAFWNAVDHEAVLDRLENVIQEWGLTDTVTLIRATSLAAPPIHDIDVLHIDGNHSDITSFIDVTKWVPLVKKGGWIIFDDMNWFENGMVTTQRAIDYLNESCHKIAEINETCLWGIWYKP
jgi:predicted O-methyltransferase YrrM